MDGVAQATAEIAETATDAGVDWLPLTPVHDAGRPPSGNRS
jgi:hypothetical protein